MTLTLIAPTFRRAASIQRLVGSAELAGMQLLIVDGSPNPLESRYRRIPGVHYHHRPELGWLQRMRLGVELAQTDFICLVHDDDIIHSTSLLKELPRSSVTRSAPEGLVFKQGVRGASKFPIKWDKSFRRELFEGPPNVEKTLKYFSRYRNLLLKTVIPKPLASKALAAGTFCVEASQDQASWELGFHLVILSNTNLVSVTESLVISQEPQRKNWTRGARSFWDWWKDLDHHQKAEFELEMGAFLDLPDGAIRQCMDLYSKRAAWSFEGNLAKLSSIVSLKRFSK